MTIEKSYRNTKTPQIKIIVIISVGNGRTGLKEGHTALMKKARICTDAVKDPWRTFDGAARKGKFNGRLPGVAG